MSDGQLAGPTFLGIVACLFLGHPKKRAGETATSERET